jgi:hypothetical protein
MICIGMPGILDVSEPTPWLNYLMHGPGFKINDLYWHARHIGYTRAKVFVLLMFRQVGVTTSDAVIWTVEINTEVLRRVIT